MTSKKSARRPRLGSTTVELLGIPSYRQGSHDGLCAYYSAAMLLAALRPEFQDQFGTPDDPIIKLMPYKKKDPKKSVSAWFFYGANLSAVNSALNRASGEHTEFGFKRWRAGNKRNGAFDVIKSDIDKGFPVLVGWSGEHIGNHAVLVYGYVKYEGGSTWLLLEDPGGDTEISTDQLVALKNGTLEFVRCNKHDGLRPGKRTITHAKDGYQVLSRKIEHWNNKLGERAAYETVFSWQG